MWYLFLLSCGIVYRNFWLKFLLFYIISGTKCQLHNCVKWHFSSTLRYLKVKINFFIKIAVILIYCKIWNYINLSSRHHTDDIELLFHILRCFITRFIPQFQFVKDFLDETVSKVNFYHDCSQRVVKLYFIYHILEK